MFELEDVLRLMQGMHQNAITQLDLHDGEAELHLRAEAGTPGQLPARLPVTAEEPVANDAPATAEVDHSRYISAPVVGVFYTAPSEEHPPYVQVGDVVAEGDVVCIIEAMKLMNEVVADCSGRIVDVLVNNGEKVEYGEKLFRLEPLGAES